jgi:O-methyltransferase
MIFRRKNIVKVEYQPDIRDFSHEEIALYNFVQPFTMTSPERVKALADSIKYIIGNQIEGAFVECGVWKGGSILVMLKVLHDLHQVDRNIFLFDTFEGMTEPTDVDIDPKGVKAKDRLSNEDKTKSWIWAKSLIDEVKGNLSVIPYPQNQLHFIQGKVEDTLTNYKPINIALLRLDTDWYESTKVELVELYDLVVPNGIIIIDDYGHWAGCKKAVDEFLDSRKEKVLLQRIDYTGRLIIKK